jgi:CrcB protein
MSCGSTFLFKSCAVSGLRPHALGVRMVARLAFGPTQRGTRQCAGPVLLNGKSPSFAGMRRTGLQRYLLIALGGALGSMARYWVAMAISGRVGAKVPYGTFVINMSACVAIGFSVTYLALHVALNPMWRYLVPIGFVGAFSTFSTFEWETFSTMRRGAFGFALLYAAGSFLLGLAAAWGGSSIAERLR